MRPSGDLSVSTNFKSDSLPLQIWRRYIGSNSFAAAMIHCSAFRSFGERRAVFAVIIVGAKRRIFVFRDDMSDWVLRWGFARAVSTRAASVVIRTIELTIRICFLSQTLSILQYLHE